MTLFRGSAKQTIPLSVLARNQTKGFGLEISTRLEVGKGTPVGSWKKELRRQLCSRHRTAEETSRHEIGSRVSEGKIYSMSNKHEGFMNFNLLMMIINLGISVVSVMKNKINLWSIYLT